MTKTQTAQYNQDSSPKIKRLKIACHFWLGRNHDFSSDGVTCHTKIRRTQGRHRNDNNKTMYKLWCIEPDYLPILSKWGALARAKGPVYQFLALFFIAFVCHHIMTTFLTSQSLHFGSQLVCTMMMCSRSCSCSNFLAVSMLRPSGSRASHEWNEFYALPPDQDLMIMTMPENRELQKNYDNSKSLCKWMKERRVGSGHDVCD